MTIDIDAIREKWATVCGPCDGGLPQGCTCPTGDPRIPISALLTEVSEVTAERDLSYDLLDGTAKALGLDLDNYHVHNEVPAKAAELVVERDQLRESARYYSALVGERNAEVERLTAERDAARKDRDEYADDNTRVAVSLVDAGRKIDDLTAELARTRAALTEANRQRTVAETAHEAAARDNTAYANENERLRTALLDVAKASGRTHVWDHQEKDWVPIVRFAARKAEVAR